MIALHYHRLLFILGMQVRRHLLLAFRPKINALNAIFILVLHLRLILANLESFVEAKNYVSAQLLDESALRIGDALLVAKDAVIELLPHVGVRRLELVLGRLRLLLSWLWLFHLRCLIFVD